MSLDLADFLTDSKTFVFVGRSSQFAVALNWNDPAEQGQSRPTRKGMRAIQTLGTQFLARDLVFDPGTKEAR